MPLPQGVTAILTASSRGNPTHVPDNVATVEEVATKLDDFIDPSANHLRWSEVSNFGDVIQLVQLHQRCVPNGAIPQPVSPDEEMRLSGGLFVRLRGRRQVHMVHPESGYWRGTGPCTLCAETVHRNFPDLVGLYWRDFIIWPNPAPIFDDHITLASNPHDEQRLTKRSLQQVFDFLVFAPQYRVFYNGPEVGASIGKHHHFQGLVPPLPVEKFETTLEGTIGTTSIGHVVGFPARVVVVRGRDRNEVCDVVEDIDRSIRARKEPDVIDLNALFVLNGDEHRVLLFPRRALGSARHQGEEINDQPGAVELSGVIVTRNESWFRNGEHGRVVTEILDDVSATVPSIRRLFQLALVTRVF